MSFFLASFFLFLYINNAKQKQQQQKKTSSLAQTSGKRHRKHLETPSLGQVSSHADTSTQTGRASSLGPAHEPLQPVQRRATHVGTWERGGRTGKHTGLSHTRLWDVHHTDSYAAGQTCTLGWLSESTRTKKGIENQKISAYPKRFLTLWLICIAVPFCSQHRRSPQASPTPELAHQEKDVVIESRPLCVCLKEHLKWKPEWHKTNRSKERTRGQR